MKKYSLIITCVAIICQICAVAQDEKDFKFLPEFKGYRFCPVSDTYLYASSDRYSIFEIDNHYFMKEYTPDNTKLKVSNSWVKLHEIKHWKDNIYWASMGGTYSFDSIPDTLGGFLVFKARTDSNNFEVLYKYNSYNVKGFEYYRNNPNKVEGFCFDKTGEYVYFLAGPSCLAKMRTENPDSIEYKVDFYNTGLTTALTCNRMFIDHEDNLWYLTHNRRIPVFDTQTEEWTVYDSTNLPFIKDVYMPKYITENGSINFQFSSEDILYLPPEHNNAVIVIGTYCNFYIEDSKRVVDTIINRVLKYENKQWDTISLPYNLIDRETIEGRIIRSYRFYKLFQWSKNEIAISLIDCYRGGFDGIKHQHKMLIYNLTTKEWREFILPRGENYPYTYVIDAIEWYGRHYILLGSNLQSLFIYDPDNSIEEPAIIKNYSLFPNPAGDDCTLSMDLTEAGSISISLSDMLGRNIMQIYDGYADAGVFTKAFNTKHLANGVYSVIIRIGDKAKAEKLIINR